MASTAISAQGSTLSVSGTTGTAKNITAIALGNPTILTSAAHGQANGDVATLAGFNGADAGLLNGVTVVLRAITANTFAVDIDTTGRNITVPAAASTAGTPPASNTATLPAPVQSAAATATTGGTLAAATYFYVVTALNAAGETIKSNEQSVVTTGTTSANTVTWGAVTGATSYRVYRGTAAGVENVFYAPGNVTTFTDTGAANTAGTPPATNTATLPAPVQSAAATATTGGALAAATYFYVVTALNAAGETIKSNEQSVVTTGTTSANTVTWGAVTGATSYRVYRGTAAGVENVFYAPGNVTTFSDTGLPVATETPVTWTQINNLISFKGFDGQANEIDRTNLSSVAKEVLLGLQDYGHFTIDVDRDFSDAGQQALDAAKRAGAIKQFKLVLPNGKAATFSGFVKNSPLDGGVDQILKTTGISIRITGDVTFA